MSPLHFIQEIPAPIFRNSPGDCTEEIAKNIRWFRGLPNGIVDVSRTAGSIAVISSLR